MSEQDDPRERSLELIRGAHAFPGPFQVRVVHHPGRAEAILEAITATCAHEDPIGATSAKTSRTGRFHSVAITLNLVSAEEVLEVYAAVRAVEGVITVL